jgi:3-dehydroquinate synthase
MLEKKIRLEYAHRILFTRDVFAPANTTISDLLLLDRPNKVPRILIFADEQVMATNPNLSTTIRSYASAHAEVLDLAAEVVVLPGGEPCKNDFSLVQHC